MALKSRPILVWFKLPGHLMIKGNIYWFRQTHSIEYIHGILEEDEDYPLNEIQACEDFLIYKRI